MVTEQKDITLIFQPLITDSTREIAEAVTVKREEIGVHSLEGGPRDGEKGPEGVVNPLFTHHNSKLLSLNVWLSNANTENLSEMYGKLRHLTYSTFLTCGGGAGCREGTGGNTQGP